MTNADRIRSLSDEELKRFLFFFQLEGGIGCKESAKVLDWLKQEVKE